MASNNNKHKKFVQFDLFSDVIAENAERVGKYGFPQLEPQEYIPEGITLPINYLLSSRNREQCWFHCFVDDKQFERLWYGFYRYVPLIKESAGLICTDFSLYRDEDEEILIRNCLRNRTMAYAFQQHGQRVIPTAGFGGESTWDWCFDGLPECSTLAITTNGTLRDPEARRLFIGGLDALVNKKHPTNLVICGKYPSWIPTKYPEINIIPIPSYSQMWKRREC